MSEVAWEFVHSVDCNAPRSFCWDYWTDIKNWDDPPAKFHMNEPFRDGAVITTELPGQVITSVIRDIHSGCSAKLEIDLPNAVFGFHWAFFDRKGDGTRITQRLVLSGAGAGAFLEQAKVMGATAPEGLKHLISAMEAAYLIG